jgi:Preprotein translocase subunit SecF
MGLINYNIEKYSPKQLVIIPLAILAVALILLILNIATTGMPVTPGIDFSGGTAVTLITTDTREQISLYFKDYPLSEISDMNNGKFLKFGLMDDAKYKSLTSVIDQRYPDARIDQIGETFGKSLQSQAVLALYFFLYWDVNCCFPVLPDICSSGGCRTFSICGHSHDSCHDEPCRNSTLARNACRTSHADWVFS